jgi:hypothetical protein
MNKFILEQSENGEITLKMGNVDMHSELVSFASTPMGGGNYYIDLENKKIYLYGESYKYGKIKIEDLKQAVKQDNILPISIKFFELYYLDIPEYNFSKNPAILSKYLKIK